MLDFFQDFGEVKNIHLNLDRQTGYVKGYVFVEYKNIEDAQKAIDEGSQEELLGKILDIDYAFVEDRGILEADKNEEERKRDKSPERS